AAARYGDHHRRPAVSRRRDDAGRRHSLSREHVHDRHRAHRGAARNRIVNLVTDEGGGPLHGEMRAEGGGLGTMRGLARLAGGARDGKLSFSMGLQHLNVTRGVDGDDRFRNSSAQGSLQVRPAKSVSLTARLWAGNSFAQINSTPFAGPASVLPT